MKNLNSLLALSILFLGVNCPNSDSNPEGVTRREIRFTGVGDYGIFDPSPAKDPASERIWMTYSEVNNSSYPDNKMINTRLAYSDNSGKK